MQQRDAFIAEIHRAAVRDNKIVFLSADLGAPALDDYRRELPAQFIHCGISEQSMVNVAVGMALAGKRPFIYAMSPFMLRAYEQLKGAANHGVPIVVVSAGPGLSYAGAGPTHYANEDLACYRTLVNTDIYTCSTANQAAALARHCVRTGRMTVARLERGELPELYAPGVDLYDGFHWPESIQGVAPWLACGYLVHRLKAAGKPVVDVYQQNPVPPALMSRLSGLDYVIAVEEQYGPGGFGAAILEALSDRGIRTRVGRKALPHRAIYENGTRDQLLESFGF